MVAAAVIGTVVAAGVGAAASSSAASKAAHAQENAANTASATQLQMYDQNRTDQAPWRQAGGTAIGQLSAGTQPGGQFTHTFNAHDFQTDPGYQFRLNEGAKNVNNSAAARGSLLSGGTLKALDQYNQDFASNEYQNAYNRFNNDQSTQYNRLASIAGLGQTATAQTGAVGANAANQIGSAQIGAGNAQAAGIVGQANAINGGLSTLGNYYQNSQYGPYGGGGNNGYPGGYNPYSSPGISSSNYSNSGTNLNYGGGLGASSRGSGDGYIIPQ